jgi:peptidoglycan LD-endopeptidase CwlK
MSARLFKDDVLFFQRFLSCCGFYGGLLDGDFGPQTGAAEVAFDQRCQAIAGSEGQFDPRSETNIRSLRTDAQVLARRSLKKLRDAGKDARIISGTRTYAEQNALFRQGRFGNAGPIVTKARGGQSWHNFGLAWDIGLFEGGAYVTRDQPYRAAAPVAKIAGLE